MLKGTQREAVQKLECDIAVKCAEANAVAEVHAREFSSLKEAHKDVVHKLESEVHASRQEALAHSSEVETLRGMNEGLEQRLQSAVDNSEKAAIEKVRHGVQTAEMVSYQ